uniref:Uncharacterized protein n=1 Tax=Anguilla anguilla TaxID=7936 RepID=A0A0E9X2R3_ANGAN
MPILSPVSLKHFKYCVCPTSDLFPHKYSLLLFPHPGTSSPIQQQTMEKGPGENESLFKLKMSIIQTYYAKL